MHRGVPFIWLCFLYNMIRKSVYMYVFDDIHTTVLPFVNYSINCFFLGFTHLTVVCILVWMTSFPRFWRNHPYCRNKWYLIWTSCLFSLRWSKFFFLWNFFSKWPTQKKLIFQLRQFSITINTYIILVLYYYLLVSDVHLSAHTNLFLHLVECIQ